MRRPRLIILDINLPGMNGKEILVRLRQTERWRRVPVLLFSTSNSEADKRFAARWNAGCMLKPSAVPDLLSLPEKFIRYCKEKEVPSGH